MTTSNSKRENKNTKALFSVICLCIIALGMIVYFSTTNAKNDPVDQQTTLVETTEAAHPVTLKETTTSKAGTTKKAQAQTTKATTQSSTMPMEKSNTPYESYYKYPLTDAVSRGYSQELTFDETMQDYRAHCAVDFSGKKDEKVVAINDGLVTKVYTDDMYGLCVEIDHGGKLVVAYCGLESANVKKGEYVDIGNQIGTLGTVPCESKSQSHLHFVAKLEGKTVNPLDVMSKTE